MTIDIDELLNDEDKVCIPSHLKQLVKDNLELVPVTSYILKSKYCEHGYTERELDYSKDYINELINEIIFANLDKVKYFDNRIYSNLFKEGRAFWLVTDNEAFEVEIDHIHPCLELVCEKEYDYILTERVYYKDNSKSRKMFINNKDFLKFGCQYINKFFQTKIEAMNYIKENS